MSNRLADLSFAATTRWRTEQFPTWWPPTRDTILSTSRQIVTGGAAELEICAFMWKLYMKKLNMWRHWLKMKQRWVHSTTTHQVSFDHRHIITFVRWQLRLRKFFVGWKNYAYGVDLATTFKNDPKLGFFWTNSFSHEDLSALSSINEKWKTSRWVT